jgi:hypothetical protein
VALADDWSWQLAQALLDAALSCEGVECSRVFVADSCNVEGLPPGCACQLAAVVTEGWAPMPRCGAQRVAEVRLVLDVCTTPPPGPDAVPDAAALSGRAREIAALRWGMMRGLRQAWLDGQLSCCGESSVPGLCSRVTPGAWRCVQSGGGSVRYETLWRFTDDV